VCAWGFGVVPISTLVVLAKPMTEHLIELEVKISHQDIAIEELKQTTFEQHLRIEALEKELKRMKDRIDAFDGGVAPVGPGNEKPPHY
jgi:uncharacterized coiled-coil protein SlyX